MLSFRFIDSGCRAVGLKQEQLMPQTVRLLFSDWGREHLRSKVFVSFFFSFVLIQKKQKIKAGKITALSCRTAMCNFGATVASAFYLYS